MRYCFSILLLLYLISIAQCMPIWSFEEVIKLPDHLRDKVGSSYAVSPSILYGRGVTTLISGYDSNNSGIFVHTKTGSNNIDGSWQYQRRIYPIDGEGRDGFGVQILLKDTSILVSAPYDNNRFVEVGAVYVYNQTSSSTWIQLQKIVPEDVTGKEHFGLSMRLSGSTLIVSASSQLMNTGAVYVYTQNSNTLLWSFKQKLLPNDALIGQYFGQTIDIYDDIIVIGARNDISQGDHAGSVYIFSKSSSTSSWSQQQKIINTDVLLFQPDRSLGHLGTKVFGREVAIGDNVTAFSVRRIDAPQPLLDAVYIYQGVQSSTQWALSQKLFSSSDTSITDDDRATLYHDIKLRIFDDALYVTVFISPSLTSSSDSNTTLSSRNSIIYIFEFIGNQYILQQRLTYHEALISSNSNNINSSMTPYNFSNPIQWGGYLLIHSNDEILLYSQYHDRSCLQLSLSDHFGDGWGNAVITIRAPDGTNNSYQPLCSYPDPFSFRYCPNQPSDEGLYIIKVFAPTLARFYWEMSWKIYMEYENQTFYGDFATELIVNFNSSINAFYHHSHENLIMANSSATCYACAAITYASWKQLQSIGLSSFFPVDVRGADYYISSFDGLILQFTGKICPSNIKTIYDTYQCYQNLYNDVYILRLGKGYAFYEDHQHVNDIDDNSHNNDRSVLPLDDAGWKVCGEQGGLRDQLIFRVIDEECIPIQKYTYTSRCDHPRGYNLNIGLQDATFAPTSSGTRSPSQDVFGSVLVQEEIVSSSSEQHHLSRSGASIGFQSIDDSHHQHEQERQMTQVDINKLNNRHVRQDQHLFVGL